MDAFTKLVIGAMVGWLLAQLADLWKRRREQKADAAYLGATVLIQLDRFIYGCASVSGDDGTSHGRPAGLTEQGQEYYAPQTDVPELSWDGTKVEWKSIAPDLMYAVLSVPLELAEAKEFLQGVADYDDPPHDEYIAARQLRFTELGVLVVKIAERLRIETGIPSRLAREWNPDSYLEDRLKVLRVRDEQIAAARLEAWPKVPATEAAAPPPSSP